MKYRILQASEWERLKELIAPEFIPLPEASIMAVAEDDNGRLVGCLPLQLAMHMEPLVLKSPAVNFKSLYKTLIDSIGNNKGLHIYVFSDKEIIDLMAEHVGMRSLPYKVFEQVVN